MKLLILGGTVFVGRHIVEAALARGHEVTLFNRGEHNPELFPEVEKLRGDRDSNLAALHGRSFDAVIDPSGYRPDQIRGVVQVLRGEIPHYTFISTISAYRRFPPGQMFNEDSPLHEGVEGYGALKARSEEELEAALPGRVTHVRPGLIVGPFDPTDRFTYWPRRLAKGGNILAPGRPSRPIQFIDARDLAAWCVRITEARNPGRFNAIGPRSQLTMGDLLETGRAVMAHNISFTWADDKILLAAGVKPWTEMPLWIPEGDSDSGGMLLGDNRRAVAAGLTFRRVVETMRDTAEWDAREIGSRPNSPRRVIPISAEREAAVLASIPRTDDIRGRSSEQASGV